MGSEGASWDIIRSHVVVQTERTVEMRSWGGRVLDHRSLVMVVRRCWTLLEVGVVVGRLTEFIGENMRWEGLELWDLVVVILVVRNVG